MNPRHLLLVLPLAAVAGSGSAHADPVHGFRCGTPDHIQNVAELRSVTPPTVLRGGAEKLIRDGFGTHNKKTSANFTVNWGNTDPLTDEEAQRVLDAAEDSWDVFVTQLGHEPPIGCDTYRLNIYVSWETDNPSIDYDGGYATIDNQGYPYLVISKNLVDSVDAVQGVVSHEIYHDFEFSYDAYWSDIGQWYWEASAEWAAQQVYPTSPNPYGFVGAVALTQELPLYFFGDPFANDPTGQHQYGMGLFQRYLTDRVDDPTVIVKSWQQASQSSDPIDVLDGLLPAGSIPGGIDAAITDFYAHNALWDYPQKDLMMGSIGAYEATYPSYKQLAAPLILSSGTGGLVDIAPNRHLHEHGAHQLVMSAGPDKVIELEIQGDASGTQGTPATWAATVIRTTDEGITYTPVPFDGTDAEMSVQLPESEGSIRLAIVVHGDGKREGETFGYKLRVGDGTGEEPEDPEDPEEEDPGCCSTSGGGAPGSALLALALFLTVSRRSRRARG